MYTHLVSHYLRQALLMHQSVTITKQSTANGKTIFPVKFN